MAGNAFIGVEVLCGTASPGLDGETVAEWVFSFVFPDGEGLELRIPVIPDGKKKGKDAHGDTGVDIVTNAKIATQKAVKEGRLSAKNAAHIGFETKTVYKGLKNGKPTYDYLGRISFWQVSSIDAAATNGKIKSKAFINGSKGLLNPLPGGVGVEIKAPPDPPKGKRWEDRLKKGKKGSTQKSEWRKFVGGGWSVPAFGHYTTRVRKTESELGDFDFGEEAESEGSIVRVPFAYIYTSPQDQITEMGRRLSLAGFECESGKGWIRPVNHIPTGLEVIGFGIETADDPFDIYGPFPWKLVIGEQRQQSTCAGSRQTGNTEGEPLGSARRDGVLPGTPLRPNLVGLNPNEGADVGHALPVDCRADANTAAAAPVGSVTDELGSMLEGPVLSPGEAVEHEEHPAHTEPPDRRS